MKNVQPLEVYTHTSNLHNTKFKPSLCIKILSKCDVSEVQGWQERVDPGRVRVGVGAPRCGRQGEDGEAEEGKEEEEGQSAQGAESDADAGYRAG